MARELRILIVSATIGAGHNRAAAAMAQELRCQCPEAHVDIVDFCSASWGIILRGMYFKMLRIFPAMFDFLYRWTSGRGERVKNLFAYGGKKRMRILCRQYNPDILLFTHPFPCASACYLRRKGDLSIPVVAIVTDFGVHPFWIYQEVDLYCIASENLSRQLLDKGIPPQHVLAFGIPISAKFAEKDTKPAANRQGLRGEASPVVLIMGGGLGFGPLEDVLLTLEGFTRSLRIIAVAGNNRGLRENLQAMARTSRHNISIMGFTEEIDALMDLADVLITKPGGLTVSEALAKQLPLLLIPAIPGHETENAEFLIRRGAAVQVCDVRAITHHLHRLLIKEPEMLRELKTAAAALAKPEAARRIAENILQLVKRRAAGEMRH